jgi:5-methylcytosine-specific restriction protein A
LFTLNQIYKRSALHDKYGGSRQNGISPSAKQPIIFVFTGSGGEQHGYRDIWVNKNVFSYTGEGQIGDMQFTRGNLQLRDHIKLGKRVFLFQNDKRSYVKYVGEMEVFDCDYFETHDTKGDLRIGIKFFFKPIGVNIYALPQELKSISSDLEGDYKVFKPNVTERQGLITTRVGQGAYRKSILHRWEYKCAATGFNDSRILIASHIVPWKDSTDNERLDVDNGILLSPDFDALFDKHLISFENTGKIILSTDIEKLDLNSIGINGKEIIKDLSLGNMEYLNKHRSKIA